jgi:hypothetical protein
MIRLKTAVNISAAWHGGQWSALYQFASSSVYLPANHLRYLQEIEGDLHPEYNLYPGFLSKKDESDLTGLKCFFIRMGENIGIKSEYVQHYIYGYNIPVFGEGTPAEIVFSATQLKYLI